jgi:carnitine 3-dehydrogenase
MQAPPIAAPLRLYAIDVPQEWVDYNQHMSEWCYLLAMGNSSDAFFGYLGIDDAYRAAGASLFTVETHIHNLSEATLGDALQLSIQILDHDAKRIHLAHEVRRDTGELIAAGEQMLLHVDTAAGRVVDLPDELLARLEAIAAAHRDLDRPPWVGHVIAVPQTAQRGTPTGGR